MHKIAIDPLFYDCFCLTYFHVGLNQPIFMFVIILLLNVIKAGTDVKL